LSRQTEGERQTEREREQRGGGGGACRTCAQKGRRGEGGRGRASERSCARCAPLTRPPTQHAFCGDVRRMSFASTYTLLPQHRRLVALSPPLPALWLLVGYRVPSVQLRERPRWRVRAHRRGLGGRCDAAVGLPPGGVQRLLGRVDGEVGRRYHEPYRGGGGGGAAGYGDDAGVSQQAP
jgi:hypothetical protein